MKFIKLSNEQKNAILNDCINTKITYGYIAKKYNVDVEDIYEVINEYCMQNGYKRFRRTKTMGVFETRTGEVVKVQNDKKIVIKKGKKNVEEERKNKQRVRALKDVQDIEEWCMKNGRKPRSTIR